MRGIDVVNIYIYGFSDENGYTSPIIIFMAELISLIISILIARKSAKSTENFPGVWRHANDWQQNSKLLSNIQ